MLLRWDAFPTARERFEERLRLIGRFSRLLNSNQVDLVILNDVPPELGRAIVTQGIRVYCADAGLDHTYVRDIQLLAADLEPFLCRARRVKLQALLGK